MLRIDIDSIWNWLKTRISDKTLSIALSALLHLGLILFFCLIPLQTGFPPSKLTKEVATSKGKHDIPGTTPLFSTTSITQRPEAKQPLLWGNPTFTQAELGPAIILEKGRLLKTHTKRPPALLPPEFTPFVPPAMTQLAIDPNLDVLKRVQPAEYNRTELEQEKQRFQRALSEDLQDCRLNQISLEETLLRLRYFRLQEQLLLQGRKPDFSYVEVRERLREKMAAIRNELNEVPPENWATALLLAYRKDKIYEEKRGHSLFNSIWYDIYNCRSGTEELLIYFSLFHPELELATVRGSVLKFDGTVMGHMDPAVKIDGKWIVFKTVSLDRVLVEEYKTGELYKLEKIVADYLPELENGRCRFGSPMARNGEPLDDDYDPYTKSDHPLVVKDQVSPIILWRESSPYSGPYRMMGREDRMQYSMLARYPRLTSERQLLNEDDPFADLLFHLLETPPAERQSLLDLYLRKRVTTYPEKFKRPLRTAAYIPGYGDLLSTLEKRPGEKLEIAPGKLVPLSQFSGHAEYLRLNRERMTELTLEQTPPEKRQLAGNVRNYLFSASRQGISAIFPPQVESRKLVSELLDDAYDLSVPADQEQLRRANGTSARAIAIIKAGLSGQHQQTQQQLEQRIALLQKVLTHQTVEFNASEERSRHEQPASLSYSETVALAGKQGLSPGFIKDMVELLGEDEALQALSNYLQPIFRADSRKYQSGLELNRQRTAEMLGYFDHYLLLKKSKQKIVQAAQQLYEHSPDLPVQVGAAQFLVSKEALEPAQAERIYALYIEQQPFDVRELRSLMATGLSAQQARKHLETKIKLMSLKGMERWPYLLLGNDQVEAELLQLDELMRGAIMLGDESAQQQIATLHTNLLLQLFEVEEAPHYANGLNVLSALSRSGTSPDNAVFGNFIEFGSKNPTGFIFANLMSHWFGQERYRNLITSTLKLQQTDFSSALQTLALLHTQEKLARIGDNLASDNELLAKYRGTLNRLVSRVATITFLNGLMFLDGQEKEADRLQTALLAQLFKQVEFSKDFASTYGTLTAARDETLLNEHLFRALEFAGHFAEKSGHPGTLDLNHAPTIILTGEFHSPCGTMAKVIDARNAPLNVLFTKAGIYLESLFDAENTPAAAAEALHHEHELVQLLTKQPLTSQTRRELKETEKFFRDLGKSGYCDIKRLYILEKLLRRAVLPERVPNWILKLAQDSYTHEMNYLARIKQAGGVETVFKDYRTLNQEQFKQKWGAQPFSIRNMYGTLLLVKMGHLQVNSSGEFEAIAVLDR